MPESLNDALNDPWRKVITAMLLVIFTTGLPITIALWQGQSALSERIARLEEYRKAGPSDIATKVQLQEQRLSWAENTVSDLRSSIRDIRNELRSISQVLNDIQTKQNQETEM